MDYYLAPSLAALRDELDARWPDRDRTSDGWIGDTSHAARKSDHNPDWDAGGVVRALDVDKDGIDVAELLDAVIGDRRVWYVIFERRIYSRTYGWKPNPYDGENPHDKHVHISLRHDQDAENDTGRWLEEEEEDMAKFLDEPLNVHDPRGNTITANVTVREALSLLVIEIAHGRPAARRYLQRSQDSEVRE